MTRDTINTCINFNTLAFKSFAETTIIPRLSSDVLVQEWRRFTDIVSDAHILDEKIERLMGQGSEAGVVGDAVVERGGGRSGWIYGGFGFTLWHEFLLPICIARVHHRALLESIVFF
jgi:hypothetical protein